MISRFGLKNYKSWKDEKHFDLGKISLIFGQNSSGKSSILQALSLLQESTQTFQLSPIREPLLFKSEAEGPRVAEVRAPTPKLEIEDKAQKYGSIENITHRGSNSEQTFYLSIKKDELLKAYYEELENKQYFYRDDGYGRYIPSTKEEVAQFKKDLATRIPKNVEDFNIRLHFSDARIRKMELYFDDRIVTTLVIDENGIIRETILAEDIKLWSNLFGLKDLGSKLESKALEQLLETYNKSGSIPEPISNDYENDLNDLQAFVLRFGKSKWRPLSDRRPHPKLTLKNFKIELEILRKKISSGHITASEISSFSDDFEFFLKRKKSRFMKPNWYTDLASSLAAFSDISAKRVREKNNEKDIKNLQRALENCMFQLKRLTKRSVWLSQREYITRKKIYEFRKKLEPVDENLSSIDSHKKDLKNRDTLYRLYHEMLSKERVSAEERGEEYSLELFMLSSSPSQEIRFFDWKSEARQILRHKGPPNNFLNEEDLLREIREQREILYEMTKIWEQYAEQLHDTKAIRERADQIFEKTKSISIKDFLEKFSSEKFLPQKIKFNFCKPARSVPILDQLKDLTADLLGNRINFNSDFHFYFDLYNQFKVNTAFNRYLNLFSILEYSITHVSKFLRNIEVIEAHREVPPRYAIDKNFSSHRLYREYFNGQISKFHVGLINLSLEILDIPYKLEDPPKEYDRKTIYKQILLIDANDNRIPIQDLGYGISQILPILMACFAKEKQTILIEQPEAQLHPKLQAHLADILSLSTVFSKNKFIIETHSEHLLLRFQRRVRELNEYEKELNGVVPSEDIIYQSLLDIETQSESTAAPIPNVNEIEKRKKRIEELLNAKNNIDVTLIEKSRDFKDPQFFLDIYTILKNTDFCVHAVTLDRKTGISNVNQIKLSKSGRYVGSFPDGFFDERYEELGL